MTQGIIDNLFFRNILGQNGNSPASTSSSNVNSTLTINSIMEAMRLMPREPFEKFRSDRGCNPKDGWVLIIPKYVANEFNGLPEYVKASLHVSSAMMINPSSVAHDLGVKPEFQSAIHRSGPRRVDGCAS